MSRDVILSSSGTLEDAVTGLEVGIDHRDERSLEEGDLLSVVDVTGPSVNRTYLVNLSKRRTSEWLRRTMVWAVSSGCRLSLRQASREDLHTRRMFVPRRES